MQRTWLTLVGSSYQFIIIANWVGIFYCGVWIMDGGKHLRNQRTGRMELWIETSESGKEQSNRLPIPIIGQYILTSGGFVVIKH